MAPQAAITPAWLALRRQQGQGEREGADSDRPEWEGRVALSFQLDKAKGVAPAQIAFAGFRSSRTSIVPNSSYCVITPNGHLHRRRTPRKRNRYSTELRGCLPERLSSLEQIVGRPNRGTIAHALVYLGGDGL